MCVVVSFKIVYTNILKIFNTAYCICQQNITLKKNIFQKINYSKSNHLNRQQKPADNYCSYQAHLCARPF